MALRMSRSQARAYGVKAKPTRASPRAKFNGYLSGYEMQYAEVLEGMRQRREITRWLYESITLRLAVKVSYTPDFLLVYPDGRLVFHEVKGYSRPVGILKLKIAARQFSFFRFVLVTKVNSLWHCEQVAD